MQQHLHLGTPLPSPCRHNLSTVRRRIGTEAKEGFGGNATGGAGGGGSRVFGHRWNATEIARCPRAANTEHGMEALKQAGVVALLIVITGCVGVALTRATSHRVYRPAYPLHKRE